MSAELPMAYLTVRPGIVSVHFMLVFPTRSKTGLVAASKLGCTVHFRLEHSYIQVIASILACVSTKVGAMWDLLAAAKLAHIIGQLQPN